MCVRARTQDMPESRQSRAALLFSLSNAMRVLNGRNSTARRLFAMRRLSSAAKTRKLFHSARSHTHTKRAHTLAH